MSRREPKDLVWLVELAPCPAAGSGTGPCRSRGPSNILLYLDSSDDVPDLLAAVEAVLELAADFDAEDGHGADEAKLVGHSISRGDRLREAIFRALAGKENPMPYTIPRPRSNLPG
jgi:hypothetical protein